jgi:hypothetical protein
LYDSNLDPPIPYPTSLSGSPGIYKTVNGLPSGLWVPQIAYNFTSAGEVNKKSPLE